MPTSPQGTPARASCTASLSVQEALPSASSVCGMPASRATIDQALGDALVLRGAAGDRRARAERARAGHARLIGVRVVVGVGDVERDRDVGLERERRRARAGVRDLLAHGRDRDDLGREVAGRGGAPRGLEHDERAEAVVERARGEPEPAQLDRLGAP